MRSFFLIACLLLSACGPIQHDNIAAVLDDVECYINARSDSALSVLRALPDQKLRHPALRARAALLHSMALDKCYIDLQTDSVIAPAVAWYARHGSADEKLKTWYYLGRTQYNAGDYQEAIVTYTEALDFTQKATDYKYVGLVNQAMADTYSASYLTEEAYPYLSRAYHAFLTAQDTVLAKLTLYKQAISDVTQRKWERADSLHQELLGNPEGIEPNISRVKASYALSLILQTSDNASKASTLFEEVLAEEGTLPTVNYWGAYAYCLSVTDQLSKARSIFTQLEALYPSDKRISFWRSKTEQRQGEYLEAYHHLQESVDYQDSVLRRTLDQSTVAAQKDYFSFKASWEKDRAQHRKTLLILLLLLFMMVAVTVALLVRQYGQKEKREKARLLLLMDTIQRQSEEAAQNRDRQYTHLFRDYFNTLGQICADYEEGKISAGSASDKAVLRRIDRIVHDFVGDAENHEAFEALLDKYLDHIMASFRKDFPSMKTQDYQLAGYVFSGMDMPTISVLMGIDVDVLYTRKSRLKSTILKSSAPDSARYLAFFR